MRIHAGTSWAQDCSRPPGLKNQTDGLLAVRTGRREEQDCSRFQRACPSPLARQCWFLLAREALVVALPGPRGSAAIPGVMFPRLPYNARPVHWESSLATGPRWLADLLWESKPCSLGGATLRMSFGR